MHGISLITIALVALFAGNNAPFVSAAKVKIVGSGASFPAGLYAAWMQQYVASYPQFIDMTYSSVGSGKGRTDTLNLLNTFGASDTIPSEANGPNNVSMVAVPVVAGAIAVAYNVPGVTKLQLTRQNVVDIFTQKIRTWGDAALVANNPSLAGNNRTIQVCVRGTNSGTTQNFLTALLKFDSTFPEQPSQLASWPLLTNPTPIKGETNEALAILVSSIPYSLAYIDLQAILSLAAAGKLSYADIQNQAGTFITPSDKSVTAAMPSTGLSDAGFGDIQGLTVDTKAATGYPISAFTFYLVRINQTSPDIETARWTFRYLWWTLTNGTSVTDAFTPVNSTAASFAVKLGFANLNDALRTRALKVLSTATQAIGASGNRIPLYGQSVCDNAPNTQGGCQNQARCSIREPFQDPSIAECQCPAGYLNINKKDCSESASGFFLFSFTDTATLVTLGISALAFVLILLIGVFIFVKRNHPRIRAIAPACSYFIVAGCLVGVFGGVAYIAVPTTPMCYARPFFPTIAFGLVFGMAAMKAYRIFTIFNYKRMRLDEKSVGSTRLMINTVIITSVNLILVGAWLGITRPIASVEETTVLDNNDNLVTFFIPVCKPDASVFANNAMKAGADAIEVFIYIYNALLAIACLTLAFRTRSAFERFQESRSLGLAVFLAALTVLVGIPIVYAIPQSDPTTVRVVLGIRSIDMVLAAVGCALMMFVPRIIEAFMTKAEDVPRPHTSDIKPISGMELGARFGGRVVMADHMASMIGEASGVSSTTGSDGTGAQYTVQAQTFDVGVRRLGIKFWDSFANILPGFGGPHMVNMWAGRVIVVLPEMDMWLIMESSKSRSVVSSHAISKTVSVRLTSSVNQTSSTRSGSKDHPQDSFQAAYGIKTSSKGAETRIRLSVYRTTADAQTIAKSVAAPQGLMHMHDEHAPNHHSISESESGRTLSKAEIAFVIEFSTADRCKAFAMLFDVARARNGASAGWQGAMGGPGTVGGAPVLGTSQGGVLGGQGRSGATTPKSISATLPSIQQSNTTPMNVPTTYGLGSSVTMADNASIYRAASTVSMGTAFDMRSPNSSTSYGMMSGGSNGSANLNSSVPLSPTAMPTFMNAQYPPSGQSSQGAQRVQLQVTQAPQPSYAQYTSTGGSKLFGDDNKLSAYHSSGVSPSRYPDKSDWQ